MTNVRGVCKRVSAVGVSASLSFDYTSACEVKVALELGYKQRGFCWANWLESACLGGIE
jgi:hypothetical protein